MIHLTAGYSYFDQRNYAEALQQFQAALRRQGGSPDEIADLQFVTAFCDFALGVGQRDMNKLQDAIGLYEKAAQTYEQVEQKKWATTKNNLGTAYYAFYALHALPTRDRTANLQKAIDAFRAAQRVWTEKDFPADWAGIQYNLGNVYAVISDGNRAENLKKAKACFEGALTVYTENGFPDHQRDTAAKLAYVEGQLSSLTSK